MKMISYDDILLFITVAKIGSFVDAAKSLHVSHTTVARRIKNFEDLIGTKLVNVSTHNFSLTFTGEKIYDAIVNLSDNYASIVEKIDHIILDKTTATGTLNVLLPPVLHRYILMPHIARFLRLYPNIRLNLELAVRDVNLIKDSIDIAISFNIPRRLDQKFRRLFSDDIGLFCSKKYIEKYGLPDTPLDLKNHLVVTGTDIDSILRSEYIFTNIYNGDIIPIKYLPQLTIKDALHQIEYVFTDEAIVPILKSIVDKLSPEAGVIQVLPEYNILSLNYYIIKNEFANSRLINLFTDFLVNSLLEEKIVLSQS